MRGLLDTMPTTLAGVREAMQYFNCGASRCRFPLRTDQGFPPRSGPGLMMTIEDHGSPARRRREAATLSSPDDPSFCFRPGARIEVTEERRRCASAPTRSPSGGRAHATGCWTKGRSRRRPVISDRVLRVVHRAGCRNSLPGVLQGLAEKSPPVTV